MHLFLVSLIEILIFSPHSSKSGMKDQIRGNHKIAYIGARKKENRHCLRVGEMMLDCYFFFLGFFFLPNLLAHGESLGIYLEFQTSGCFSGRKV